MNFSTQSTDRTIRIVFFIMAAVLSFAWATNVHADTKPSSQLSIAASGQVIAKDAVVVAISGDVLTVRTAWNSVSITWTVYTTGSTRFQPAASSTVSALQQIKVGDSLSFSGEINFSASTPTVTANMVKDTSIERDQVTTRGAVIGVDAGSKSFTLSGTTGTTTVNVGSGTIMTLDGNAAEIGDLPIGGEVQVMGSMNMSTNTVQAQRISWKTTSQSVTTARQGRISGFFSWLLGSRGALSLMGR